MLVETRRKEEGERRKRERERKKKDLEARRRRRRTIKPWGVICHGGTRRDIDVRSLSAQLSLLLLTVW